MLTVLTALAGPASAQYILLVTQPASPVTYGQQVALVAYLYGNSNCTGDAVSFYEVFNGGTFIGNLLGTSAAAPTSGPPVTSCIAAIVVPNSTTATFSVGTHMLQAYSTGFLTLSPINLVVNKASTTTTLGSAPNPSTFGQTVTLSAQVSPLGATGTVTFFDNGATLTAGSVGYGGFATAETNALTAGNHTLTASYGGDPNYNPSSAQPPVSQTVNQAPTTTSLQAAPPTSVAGQTVALTASVSPAGATGSVTFLDNGNPIGGAPLNGGTANFSTSSLSVGSHSLTASYPGNTNYTSSVSSPVTESVAQVTTTALTANPNPSVAGQNVTLTATVTPANATGTVSFYDGASLLGTGFLGNGAASLTASFLAGNHSLTASYGGDANNAPSTSPAVSQSVTPATPGTITSLVPSTAAAGSAGFTLTVNGAGFSGGATVQWNGIGLSTSPLSDTQVTASVPANLIASPGTVTITVATAGGNTGGAPFLVNPSGQPCSFTLTSSSAGFPASGGSGSIAVTASRTDCTWTGATTAPWISGFNTLTGNGTLKFTVAANTGATSRIGAIGIGAQNFNVIQGGTKCTYTLPFASQVFAAAGGAGTAIVRAPPGCPWTAAGVPGIAITSPTSGFGDGSVTYTIAPNASAGTLTGALTIANHPYSVIQSGTASTANCTAGVPSVTQAALEGRTETLGDLLLNCRGLSGNLKADVTLTLNTNVTNTLAGNLNATDAVLIVNGGAPQSGLVGGYNSLRWFGVPIVPGGDGGATLRISNVRADASLLAISGNFQPTSIAGRVSVAFLSQGNASQSTLSEVPVAGALQTMASAAPMLLFTKIQASPPAGGLQTFLPLTFQEAAASAFHGGTTRFRVVLSNLPPTVQVFAPVYPAEGTTRAQLYSADANGAGGAPLTGTQMAGGTYQQLTISGNKATATWLVLSADPAQVETWTFPLLLLNAATGDLNQIQISGNLGPVSNVTISSSTAPPQRYQDFSQVQATVNLRGDGAACQAPVGLPAVKAPQPLLGGGSPTCGPNVIDVSVTNDATDPTQTATNAKVTGNVPSGLNVTGCMGMGGTTCSHSGNQVTLNCGTLPPGQTCSGSIMTQPDPSVPGGTPLDVSASASSDQPNLDPFSATGDSSFILLTGSPAAVAETPASGSGPMQSFTFQFSDPSGYQSLGVVNVLINNFLDGRGACYLAYVVSSSTLVLVDDAGDAGGPYAGSLVLGSSSTIQNSQCAVTLTSALGAANTLTLGLNIAFKPAFGGNRIINVAARDQAQGNSDWQPLGIWQVPFTPPGTIAVTGLIPARGAAPSGTNQQFVLTLTDTKGAGDFGIVDVLINKFIDGRQACYLAYVASSGSLILIDDTGDAGGPYAGSMALNGGSGTIQNSQCMVSGTGSAANLTPNTLTLTLNITFKAALAGNRVVYAAGRDGTGGNNTDWQAVGTFTVQ